VASVEFAGKWKFNRQRGALLVLLNPRIEYIRTFPLAIVRDETFKSSLYNRVICTEVVSCPGFCLYLGNSQEHVFELSLKADVPIPIAAPLKAGGGLGMNWKFGNTQGIVKEGLDAQGNHVFFPLFSLKTIKWGKTSTVSRAEDEDEMLGKLEKPWKQLDEAGQEIDFDTDYD